MSSLFETIASLMLDLTGTSKNWEHPQVTVHQTVDAHVDAYNAAHPDSPDLTADDFGAPAFAVEGAVHFLASGKDWVQGGQVCELKLVSTLVHEVIA